MLLAEAVAKRLDELLEERKITAYKLFILSGVGQSTISAIRNKKNRSVDLRIIYELTQGLEISLTEFFDSPLFSVENIVD